MKKLNDNEAMCWFREENGFKQKVCMCGDVGQYQNFEFKSGKERTSTRACYEIKNFGKDNGSYTNCTEEYETENSSLLKLTNISCDSKSLHFLPNGSFHYARVHEFFMDYKKKDSDSLLIAHGRCGSL